MPKAGHIQHQKHLQRENSSRAASRGQIETPESSWEIDRSSSAPLDSRQQTPFGYDSHSAIGSPPSTAGQTVSTHRATTPFGSPVPRFQKPHNRDLDLWEGGEEPTGVDLEMGRKLTPGEINPQPLLGAFREEIKTTIRKPDRENWVLKPFVLKEHKRNKAKVQSGLGPGAYDWEECGQYKSMAERMTAHDQNLFGITSPIKAHKPEP